MAATAKRPRDRRPVHGLLLLNKPAGLTSNQALQRVRRLLRAQKAGHTGSLDPAATGMLPLCFGDATKVSGYLLAADKRYRVVARLGAATDTGDADGKETARAPVPALDAAAWQGILGRFHGDLEQVPPMYSALKRDGRRLYELARQGQEVERAPRRVRVEAIELLECRGTRLAFRVRCSKGTYVRTLVEDIARCAGTVAHTAALHRESVASFDPQDMLALDAAEALVATGGVAALDARLLPVDAALAGWPACRLGADGERFARGQPVTLPAAERAPRGSLLRVYGGGGRFLGLGEATADGRLAPRRIFAVTGRKQTLE